MKKISYYLIAASITILGLTSCEKELMSYEGLEGVYFAVQSGSSWGSDKSWPYMPYTNLEFIKVAGNQTTLNIKVMATGPLKEHDRTFKVEVNPDSTTAVLGVHYDAIPAEVTIPANSCVAYIPVVLHRTPEMKTTKLTLGLRLVANKDFALSFTHWDAVPGFTSGTVYPTFDASLHSIIISDFLVQPAVWTGSVNSIGQETGLWGAFSRKKLDRMCARFNLTYNDFMSTTTMPLVLQRLITTAVSKDLIELYNKHTPVLEDDGRLMYLGECPWASYPGVPWVPEY